MKMSFVGKLFYALGMGGLLALSGCGASNEEFAREIEALKARIQQQEDIEAVRRVAFSYGYYMDNALMDQIIALLADEPEYCEISGYGLYRGLSGCTKIWRDILGPGLQNEDGRLKFGRLIKHYLVKDIITIAPDGMSAEGRFDYIGYSGVFSAPQRNTQQLGVYRMGFVKEDGVWKINRFNLFFDTSDWNDRNWVETTTLRCPRPNAPEPDAPFLLHHPFPEHATVPFAEVHPVTQEKIPDYVNPTRHWQGNWPGEFGGPCGVRAPENAAKSSGR